MSLRQADEPLGASQILNRNLSFGEDFFGQIKVFLCPRFPLQAIHGAHSPHGLTRTKRYDASLPSTFAALRSASPLVEKNP